MITPHGLLILEQTLCVARIVIRSKYALRRVLCNKPVGPNREAAFKSCWLSFCSSSSYLLWYLLPSLLFLREWEELEPCAVFGWLLVLRRLDIPFLSILIFAGSFYGTLLNNILSICLTLADKSTAFGKMSSGEGRRCLSNEMLSKEAAARISILKRCSITNIGKWGRGRKEKFVRGGTTIILTFTTIWLHLNLKSHIGITKITQNSTCLQLTNLGASRSLIDNHHLTFTPCQTLPEARLSLRATHNKPHTTSADSFKVLEEEEKGGVDVTLQARSQRIIRKDKRSSEVLSSRRFTPLLPPFRHKADEVLSKKQTI